MAVALETIVKQLADSGIISPGKLEDFIPPKTHPQSVEELVAELVKHNHLTTFQAHQVKAGKARALILGSYTILDRIGAGGMGQVFKAWHRKMDRLVAIKMLPNAMMKNAEAAARFEREVRAAAKLNHTNIVTAYDADQANGIHFLAMEYVEGKDLSALVKKDGPLPVAKAVNYILQAARGLEFAHQKGVIHRDIKPANLLLGKDGTVKILDMGLARLDSPGSSAASGAELTGTGTVMGTVDYMAPEQALSTHNADARADIYSLGCTFYYLLIGKPIYERESVAAKLVAHQSQPIPRIRQLRADVSEPVDAVFHKMAAKEVDGRFQTMSQVISALASIEANGSGAGLKETAAWRPPASENQGTVELASGTTNNKLASLTQVVASEKSKHFLVKIVGGSFATIIAPILVAYLLKHLDSGNSPPTSHSASASAVANPSPATNENVPTFEQWMKDVATLPPGKQVDAVAKKLVELNSGFDGQIVPRIDNGTVIGIKFFSDNVSDISPLRALSGLQALECFGSTGKIGRLADLSPLRGMSLTTLDCGSTRVSDLSPLQGMKLTNLKCSLTQVNNLSPLAGMPLTTLTCGRTKVTDLSPLQSCKSLKSIMMKAMPKKNFTAADVAALQKALPDCKIFWDDSTKPRSGKPDDSGTK